MSEEATSTVSLVRLYTKKNQQGIVKIKLIYAGNLHITTLQRLRDQMLICETDIDQRT
ncbi:hypothetical protein [Snodgrassella alvi]|uniref:hypothetical protein n=1 Tax=Snodgrassella alvi TaxID=1196083 RepID=UPI0015539C1A|nr:hypothetical protein [Snodgrassella alvi]